MRAKLNHMYTIFSINGPLPLTLLQNNTHMLTKDSIICFNYTHTTYTYPYGSTLALFFQTILSLAANLSPTLKFSFAFSIHSRMMLTFSYSFTRETFHVSTLNIFRSTPLSYNFISVCITQRRERERAKELEEDKGTRKHT